MANWVIIQAWAFNLDQIAAVREAGGEYLVFTAGDDPFVLPKQVGTRLMTVLYIEGQNVSD